MGNLIELLAFRKVKDGSMKIRAFALIELLVIIATTILLLSIMMPVLQKAKQHALRMICKNNPHNYITDNLYLAENRLGSK